jgi:hypothetical protein
MAGSGNRQKNGTSLAALLHGSGNRLPLFWHVLPVNALKPTEYGLCNNWHGPCYVSVTNIWSTAKGFPT